MQLCDFCGFVIGQEDNKCKNCSSQVPGREIIKEADNLKLSPHTPKRPILYTHHPVIGVVIFHVRLWLYF